MQNPLKIYLRRLINLTARNRSLLLLNLPKEQFIDLHTFDFLDNNPSFQVISQLMMQRKAITLCDILDSRFDKVNEASMQLKSIAKTVKFIEEERGSNDLYVGYPTVKGKLQDGTLIRCPLLFWAVSLKNNDKKWLLESQQEPAFFNQSFLLAYAHFNQLNIGDEWLEATLEDNHESSLSFRNQLYTYLKESPIELNFNPEIFEDKLQHFEKLSKNDLEQTERNGELKLYPQAILGVFPQAGSYLVPDYNFLLDQQEHGDDESESFENLFKHAEENLNVKEEHTFLPFSIDASQEQAILAIKKGKSMVIEGPPGTGKSQLIANLMADFAARGKKVLLVCQKRVALDTVYNRLSTVQYNASKLQHFVALVHDIKQDRKVLFEQLLNQIENIEAYKKSNLSLDVVFLERNFTNISRRIDQISKELNELKFALFDDSIAGESIKKMYLSSDPKATKIDLTSLYTQFKINEIQSFENKIKHCVAYEQLLNNNEFWNKRKSFEKFNFSVIQVIEGQINAIELTQKKLEKETELLLDKKISVEAIVLLEEGNLNNFISIFENKQQVAFFNAIIGQQKYYIKTANSAKFKECFEQLKDIAQTGGCEKTLDLQTLNIRKSQLLKAIESSKSNIGWFFWKSFSKDKKTIEELIFANKYSLVKADLAALLKKIENRLLFENISRQFSTIGLELSLNDSSAQQESLIYDVLQANVAYRAFKPLSYLKNTKIFNADLLTTCKDLLGIIKNLKAEFLLWQTHLSDSQIKNILNNEADKSLIISFLHQNFDSFVTFDKLKNSLNTTENSVLALLKNTEGDKLKIFQNSVRLAWINHIEEQYPILHGVSSLKVNQLEEELRQCVLEKQSLSEAILLIKLREHTYNDLELNRLQNVVSYRELLHQVRKRKKIWSIRKVLESFNDEIFKLVPCWLASPESVSTIFPMQANLFDLVIFDEASQCFAEQGIPAIYRGKQVVVVGDSKQLQPTDLYQIRYEADSEDNPVLEVDSLLSLAYHYLPNTQLLGHYRSHSIDLIAFSNKHFYKNTLHLLPNYQSIIKNKPAINYISVAGVWENNVNEIEAKTVVDLVKKIQNDEPQKSIGIISFNHKQAKLIDDLLIINANINIDTQKKSSVMDNIFVKNIENVQGDERDIIIFSIGYAPNAKGNMLMQFGSLNSAGGENRLNVAITRAKEQIYVVSSIMANQLRVEDTANEGPKLLKKYLEFAFEVAQGMFKLPSYISEKYNNEYALNAKLIVENTTLAQDYPFVDINNKIDIDALLLTDDAIYHDSLSPKDAHAYLPLNLINKGWKFQRLWSRNYWNSSLTIK